MKITKRLANELKAGDVVVAGDERLTVAAVDASAAFTIVDFTDGTATAPLVHGVWAYVEEEAR